LRGVSKDAASAPVAIIRGSPLRGERLRMTAAFVAAICPRRIEKAAMRARAQSGFLRVSVCCRSQPAQRECVDRNTLAKIAGLDDD
jgi:hypothetical protein